MDAIPLIRARYLQAFTAVVERTGARSLQRRLASEGLTFSQLVDEVRLEMAVPQLRDPGIRPTDIALRGYSDPAHFTRAFGRWAGVAPSEYRAHQAVS